MENQAEMDVRSNVLLGALNSALIILVYFFIIVLGYMYVKYFHGIDIITIFSSSLTSTPLPFGAEIFSFMGFLVEDFLVTVAVLALIYAAFISNYQVKIKDNKLMYKRGFLFLQKESFELEDIEQVFTENYPFFKNTKRLCIKALDEDLISIPYVKNASKIRSRLIESVKLRHHNLEIKDLLQSPIKVMDWKPQ